LVDSFELALMFMEIKFWFNKRLSKRLLVLKK